jgi:hypothetical protein
VKLFSWIWPGLRLAQPESPTDGLSALFSILCLRTETEFSFRNVVVLECYNSDDERITKERLYIL